jgi:hypothetical protein
MTVFRMRANIKITVILKLVAEDEMGGSCSTNGGEEERL